MGWYLIKHRDKFTFTFMQVVGPNTTYISCVLYKFVYLTTRSEKIDKFDLSFKKSRSSYTFDRNEPKLNSLGNF